MQLSHALPGPGEEAVRGPQAQPPTRRHLRDEPAYGQRPRAVFDLTETIALALHSLRDGSSEGDAIIASLPEAPVRVMGHAPSLGRAVTRTSAILADAGRGPAGPAGLSLLEATVAVALTRAGARLDLTVPGVEISAAALTEVVEAFLAATSRPRAASGVNVQVIAGRVCVVTDPVTATTSADETTVSAVWELEGSLDDVA